MLPEHNSIALLKCNWQQRLEDCMGLSSVINGCCCLQTNNSSGYTIIWVRSRCADSHYLFPRRTASFTRSLSNGIPRTEFILYLFHIIKLFSYKSSSVYLVAITPLNINKCNTTKINYIIIIINLLYEILPTYFFPYGNY